MAYWLIKTDPETYSWRDLMREKRTWWDGVRNFQARNNLRAMKVGDTLFVYHSVDERQVMGLAKVVGAPKPEVKDANWTAVEVEAKKTLARPVTLLAIKARKDLARCELLRQSRLSVVPVRDEEAAILMDMGA